MSRHGRARLALLGAALVLGWLAFAARPVEADTGVAIDIGAVDISQSLSKGGRYELPTIGVRNPGSEPTRYRMSVTYFADQQARRAPAAWFEFSPTEFDLEPGAVQGVQVTLRIPPDAAPDRYQALVQATIATRLAGATAGGAAAARVSFEVRPSSLLEAWWRLARDWAGDHSIALGVGVTLLLMVSLVVLVPRRFRIRLERR